MPSDDDTGISAGPRESDDSSLHGGEELYYGGEDSDEEEMFYKSSSKVPLHGSSHNNLDQLRLTVRTSYLYSVIHLIFRVDKFLKVKGLHCGILQFP